MENIENVEELNKTAEEALKMVSDIQELDSETREQITNIIKKAKREYGENTAEMDAAEELAETLTENSDEIVTELKDQIKELTEMVKEQKKVLEEMQKETVTGRLNQFKEDTKNFFTDLKHTAKERLDSIKDFVRTKHDDFVKDSMMLQKEDNQRLIDYYSIKLSKHNEKSQQKQAAIKQKYKEKLHKKQDRNVALAAIKNVFSRNKQDLNAVKEATVLDEAALDDKLKEECKHLKEKVNKYISKIEPLTKKNADLQYQLDNFEETRAERNTLDKKLISMGEKIKETMDKEMDLGQVKDEVDRDER